MENSSIIILFLFEHEREGYKRHADCTVLQFMTCLSGRLLVLAI